MALLIISSLNDDSLVIIELVVWLIIHYDQSTELMMNTAFNDRS